MLDGGLENITIIKEHINIIFGIGINGELEIILFVI
jgi:hypothetical protein